MKESYTTNGPFLIEGQMFELRGLLSFCAGSSADPAVPDWKKNVLEFVAAFLDPGHKGILQKTSGTTGPPKSMMLRRESMINSARKTLRFFGLVPGDKVLLCLPVQYIAGKMMVVRALVGGLDLLMTEPSGRPLKDLPEKNIKFASMVPLQLHDSLENGDTLSMLDILLVGGGEVHHKLRDRLLSLSKPQIFESFATTETYTHFALRRINGSTPDTAFRLMEGVHVNTDHMDRLVVDIPGITNGAVDTGDLVELTADGSGFHWLGRHDNLIKSGGKKVIPELLEARVKAITGKECLVLPEKDTRLGQRIVLMLETEEELSVEPLTRKIKMELPPHLRPRRIIPVKELPRNQSFKPDRQAAKKLIGRHSAGS